MASFVPKSEVAAAVGNVTAAMGTLEAALTDGEEAVARRHLRQEAMKLLSSLGDPNEDVWPRIYQVNVSAVIEIFTNLGLWDEFTKSTTISLATIVDKTGGDEVMMTRLLQQLTASGILKDSPGPEYTLTALGKPYLDENHRAFNSFLLQEVIPSIVAMPRTLAEHGFKSPTRESGTPFKWANGEELWTFLGSHPQRAQNMVKGMKSLSTGTLAGTAYPFGEELGKLDVQDGDVAIVDIAGGQGHVMEEVRKLNPQLKGRFIVQDLPSTFEAVPRPPPGVEFMPYDMFTSQPIKDAHVYYYRHIFHDWNDEDVSRFLQQLLPVLKARPRSKLLLVDLVLPDLNVGIYEAARDISMFPIGGLERTERQWQNLLAANGLKIKKIWRGTEPEACVECEVA
ncbi:hypothetical protein PFICI_02561 [Pestalotiopsis fici W106-1]|uniref:Uncharacterized protein n=1 Tax=Pestalotiopsis fici (strain W106-1 / CGMCC3.15140) TaxID=1229662 RepID=W3XH28_PESFW|nr:uncharacterized protein PFICI_02561 [Pestalotiopsis fici W106-1]ETS84536.1 hypothetical protein PFICI_02561 [Pestalotiopsis fici W106-1]